MDIYAIVVWDPAGRGFDDVAERSTSALQNAALSPLYLSNPMVGTSRDVDDCDFEAWVRSHGEMLETLNAEHQPYGSGEYVHFLAGLVSATFRAISDQVDENGLARGELDRAMDAWDEFEQAIAPPEERDHRALEGGLMGNDAAVEQAIDRRVQRRLATDRAYLHAENAEVQAAREEAITRQVERELGVNEEERDGPDHRRNPAPFCSKCGGPCEMEES